MSFLHEHCHNGGVEASTSIFLITSGSVYRLLGGHPQSGRASRVLIPSIIILSVILKSLKMVYSVNVVHGSTNFLEKSKLSQYRLCMVGHVYNPRSISHL